jgi:hypothetical protein
VQAVSNSLWAYAKLSFNPGHEVLDIAGRRALQSLHQYSSQEISNCLWAFATLEHHPGVQLLDAAAIQVGQAANGHTRTYMRKHAAKQRIASQSI